MSFLLTPGVLQQQANRAGGKQYALDFDGVDDYVEIFLSEELSDSGLSIQFDFNPDQMDDFAGIIGYGGSTAYNELVFRRTSTGDYQLLVDYRGNRVSLNIDEADIIEGEFNLYNIAFTLDSEEQKLYLDGSLKDSDNNNSSFNFDHLVMGRYEGGDGALFYYNGVVSNVAIFKNRILTQQEIQDNIGVQLNGDESGLLAYYPMTKESGDTLPDKTDNNNHGTIYGANWVEL